MGKNPEEGRLKREGKRFVEIRLRYCGGCHPEIDRSSVAGGLQALAAAEGIEARFIRGEGGDALLLINGCGHACLDEEGLDTGETIPCFSVQGAMIDHRPVDEGELPHLLWEKLRASLL